MLGSGKSVLGLDLGTKFIKCVEISLEKSGLSVQNFGVMEINQGENIWDALRDFLRKHRFSTRRTVTAISGRSVIVRYITMGVLSDVELKNAIKYEASKYIPFEVEEVQIDYYKLEEPKADSKEMKIVLAAAKKSFVVEHLDALEKLGLNPIIIDCDVFALGNAFETIMSDKVPSNEVISLLDVGATKSCINIMSNNVSAFTREIYIGGFTFTDLISQKLKIDPNQAEVIKKNPGTQEDSIKDILSVAFDDLCHEIRLSLDFYENSCDREVKSIYLSGGASKTAGLQDFLSENLNREVKHWNPCAEPLETRNINKQEMDRVANQFAIAVGLASRIKK